MSAAILSAAEAKEAEAHKLYASLYDYAPPVGVTDAHRWRCDTLDRIDELREEAASIRTRVSSSIEHIRNYYGLAVHVGMDVKHNGRPGRIVGFSGQYIEVQLDGDDHPTTCHATSEMEYPPRTRVGPDPDERFAHLVEVRPA
ncbi:hypothetical protein PV569_34025 [Streptomyces scabiei]|uniref:hypothetical protein n=1 Tax=Streptomyces scabiei TaxID=1930 RepID=UPI0029A210A6|nr:hypothetical protein [Streptomyces scabiei]MDX3298683.1 hypothetical protein [Streptomyces scabiei]